MYEFFYPLLQPYVHYVPLARGLEDLYSAIEWARAHPEACKRIIQEGQNFAKRYFNTEFIALYMSTLLSQYAQRLKFKPVLTPAYQKVLLDAESYSRLGRSAGGCPFYSNV